MRKRIRISKPVWVLAVAVVVLLTMVCVITQSVQKKAAELEKSPQIAVLGPEGEFLQLELEQFLVGVLAAEMPASFGEEALAAQAVAARTYILGKLPPYGSGKHGEAAVCTDSTCCQAWQSQAELAEKWGGDFDRYYEKVVAAVRQTFGQVLFYEAVPIEAPFFSTCGGSTEAAADCWGGQRAYLQAVSCSWDMHSPRLVSYTALSVSEAATLLGASAAELRAMQVAGYTAGGRVAAVQLAEQQLAGTEVRSRLGLAFAAFNWLIVGETIVFANIGYGHGSIGAAQAKQGGQHRHGIAL